MSLVKTLIELHGGTLETRSGAGYRVVVCRLPDDRAQISDVRSERAVVATGE
jgi:hypothetical protein